MKEKIRKWYPKLWTIYMVRDAVIRNVINPQDFEEITGEKY